MLFEQMKEKVVTKDDLYLLEKRIDRFEKSLGGRLNEIEKNLIRLEFKIENLKLILQLGAVMIAAILVLSIVLKL